MLTAAGKEGKSTVFLLTDTQIKEEAFLEDVDGLLNAGEVANLFALDEKQEILEVGVVRGGASWGWPSVPLGTTSTTASASSPLLSTAAPSTGSRPGPRMPSVSAWGAQNRMIRPLKIKGFFPLITG